MLTRGGRAAHARVAACAAVRRGAAALILGASNPVPPSPAPGRIRRATAENNNAMQASTAPVTFLFTDIEGSTRLWETTPERCAPRSRATTRSARHAVTAPPRTRRQDDRRRNARGVRRSARCDRRDDRAAAGARGPGGDRRRRAARALRPAPRRRRAPRRRFLRPRRQSRGAHHERRARRADPRLGGRRRARPRPPARRRRRCAISASVRLRDLASPEQIFQVVHPALRESFPGAALARGDAEQPAAAGDLVHRPRARAGRRSRSCSRSTGC